LFRVRIGELHRNQSAMAEEETKKKKGIVKCSANYIPLTPISFLERSAIVYRDRVSIIYRDLKFTWKQTRDRCASLASAIADLGISRGDVVAALAPNIPAMYELHFAVPMAGAILCALNTRHDSAMVSTLLHHSEAKLVFVDYELLHIALGAFKILSGKGIKQPSLVVIPDPDRDPDGGFPEYESLVSSGRSDFAVVRPIDECEPIALNYTSGTTSRPKGVFYSHRGAYLNSFASILLTEMKSMPVFLWTVPMLHCNGWCFTWAMAAQGGVNVCLRNVNAGDIFAAIFAHGVTHMGCAPTVMNTMINSDASSERKRVPGKVTVLTGGAPPPPKVLHKMEEMGFIVVHSYGLTETYGPGTNCTWMPEWNALTPDLRARMKARQGLHHLGLEEVDVKDPNTMRSVPLDGKTIGEVMFRGNTVMLGYLKDVKATEEAFEKGWFRTGDLGVRHGDGYLELKDRSKDVIISGGENISTIEVESVMYNHPAVMEAAVVGRRDDHWGETPVAFVKLKDGRDATADEIIGFCRERLPHYMAPKGVVFLRDLPKTSTGKIQKFVLKEKANAMGTLTTRSK
ncbi:hypothetical protein M569_17244, partial [Genlisea aurea]